MRLALFALLIIPSLALASPKCGEGDALAGLTKDQLQVMKSLGPLWAKNAMWCDFGSYQIIVSADPKADGMVLLRGGKMFVLYEPGYGINLFQDLGSKENVPYLSVQDWGNTGKFKRVHYNLFDTDGNVIGVVLDKEMTGEVTVTKYGEKAKQTR